MNSQARFPFLDAIRGICILGVVAIHCFYAPDASKSSWATLYSSLTSSGWIGVPIFFVLSGFLISMPLFSKPARFDWKRYALRRATKIMPPLLIVLALIATRDLIKGRDVAEVGLELLASISTFAHVWYPWPPLNGVLWSLYVEVHFYLLLPFLYLGLMRLNFKTENKSHMAGWIVALIFLFSALLFRMLDVICFGVPTEEDGQRFALFPRVFDYFAWGMGFSLFFLRNPNFPKAKAKVIGVTGGCLLLLVYGTYSILRYFHFPISRWLMLEIFHVIIPLSVVMCLFMCYEKRCSFPLFRSKVLTFLGVVSYEWYLLHGPVQHFLWQYRCEARGNVFIYLWNTGAPLSLALSAALYLLLSRPLLQFVHNQQGYTQTNNPITAGKV